MSCKQSKTLKKQKQEELDKEFRKIRFQNVIMKRKDNIDNLNNSLKRMSSKATVIKRFK